VPIARHTMPIVGPIGRHTFVPYYTNNQHDETFHYKACYIVAMPPQIQQMRPWALRYAPPQIQHEAGCTMFSRCPSVCVCVRMRTCVPGRRNCPIGLPSTSGLKMFCLDVKENFTSAWYFESCFSTNAKSFLSSFSEHTGQQTKHEYMH